MLATNEAVAGSFQERGEDTLWRIHDAPDRARLEEFAALAENYGIPVDIDEARTPKGLKRVLDKLKGHAAEKALSFQLLRSLKQATYDVVNIGHFGLASADYLHFTSPIRRYPDLIVHRLLKSRLAGLGKPAGGVKPPSVAPVPDRIALQKMAAESSFSERQAMEVEREVVDLYRAYFMRDRVGDVLEGVISGVTSFGLFVTIDDPFVEGLVRIDAISDDYYTFDEKASRLVGRRSGQAFALGDSVKVEVQSVSVVRRKIDFALADHVARHRARDFQRGDKRRRDGRSARRGEAPKGSQKGSERGAARPRDGFRRGKPGSGAGGSHADRPKSGGRGNPPRGKPKKKGR
jgi:ribonuclease R